MKTVIRNSYTPKIGDYCETIVVDRETNNAYIFDCDGVFTPIPWPVDVEKILEEAAEYTDETVAPINEKLETIEEGAQVNVIEHILRNGTPLTITDKTVNITVPTKTSDLSNDGSDGTDTYVESAALGDYYTKQETDTQIGYETTAREIADQGLQEQIDAIAASSDVVDIVGTYAALQAYDTTKLHDNDIIKVLDDETRDDATTYYRWLKNTSTWSYIGSEGPFYTKAESDAIFTPMTRTINSKALSADITLTASDVGALPDSTVIPTVNDATLTIQENGVDVQTFTANQSTNATANITVPTDTSDLTNGAGFITSAALPTKTSELQNDGSDGTDTYAEMSDLPTKTSDLQNDGSDGTSTYVEADDLATVATSGDYTDLINKPTIPTVNDGVLTIQKNGTAIDTFSANQSGNTTVNVTVPTDTSDLTNNAGFITSSVSNLTNYYTKTDTYTQAEVNGLINAITIPTKTSDLQNDGSDGTSTYVEADDLATVATSGSYADLLNKPTNFTGTDGVNAGTSGFVPAPATTDVNKYLKGDGTWGSPDADSNKIYTLTTLTAGTYANGVLRDDNNNRVTGNIPYMDLYDGETVVFKYDASLYQVIHAGDSDEGFRWFEIHDETTSGVDVYTITVSDTTANSDSISVKHVNALTAGTNITISSGAISAPSNVSAFTNDAGYLTSSSLSNYYTKSETYSQQEVNGLINAITVPTKTSDLQNDGSDGTSTYVEADDLATVATSGSYNDLLNTPIIPTIVDMTGATASTAGAHGYVPAPAAGDQDKVLKGDGTWGTVAAPYSAGTGIDITSNVISADTTVLATKTDLLSKQDVLTEGNAIDIDEYGVISVDVDSALSVSSTNPVQNSVVTAAINNKSDKFIIMKYGEANAWAKFLDAYTNNKIVYCRASSNSNPATGAQTRLAFMAYVDDETTPTSVEFQYVRSVKTKTDSQQGDQTYIYKLSNTSGGTWTVESRDNFTKVLVDSSLTKTYTSGTSGKITLKANAMVGATSGTAGSAGYVPAPAAGDDVKYLKGDGSWATIPSANNINSTDWNALWQ